MKKRIIIIAVIIILSGIFFIIKRKKELSHAPVVKERPVIVHTVQVQRRDIEYRKEYLGEIIPSKQAKVCARINAPVIKIYVDEGDIVKKGELLAELDSRELEIKLKRAKADLVGARQNLIYWKKEYNRDKHLFKNGAISEEDRDRTLNNLQQAQSRYNIAKENVSYLATYLSYTKIKAPFNGIVDRRMVDPGDMALIGKTLFVINSNREPKLVFNVPQEDISLIKEGQTVYFRYNKKIVKTRISTIFPSFEDGKTVKVEALIPEDTISITGEFVPVNVIILKRKAVMVIPKRAIIFSKKKQPFVFVVEDNRLKAYPVHTGLITDEWVEIKNISSGSNVVVGSYLSWSSLSSGQPVIAVSEQ